MKDSDTGTEPRRSPEEEALLSRAKALLMDRRGMTEGQAHRFLQKKSMDSGARLAETARQLLKEYSTGKDA